jgi:GntR family transcriptional repressor for pyruvate dehydrogenase complex
MTVGTLWGVSELFRPITTPRAFEAILEQLKDAIAAGTLKAGDRLPAERELAERFAVSRTSVREAVRVLEALGIIGVRRGADHGAVLLTEPGNAFTTILDLLVALRHVPLQDVVEFRVMLESSAARRLATTRGPALAALGELLSRLEDPQLPRAEFHRLDAEFHVALVRSGGNSLVNLVESAADRTLRTIIANVSLLGPDWTVVRARLIAEHRAIFAAISAGEAQVASECVSEHIRYWGESVIAAVHSS